MESITSSDRKRFLTGIFIGIGILILAALVTALAFLMVSVIVFGCTKSPPEWIYMFVFAGFPIPLIIISIVVPYLYIKRQRLLWMIFAPIAGLFLSCLIFFIWFLILTQYC
ncbi:MAG: hypothetical protein ABI792_04385 [bacterium]